MKTTSVEFWLVIDSEGDWHVGTDQDEARQHYEENVGELKEADGFRMVKVSLTVPLPTVAELTGVVPDNGEPSALKAE